MHYILACVRTEHILQLEDNEKCRKNLFSTNKRVLFKLSLPTGSHCEAHSEQISFDVLAKLLLIVVILICSSICSIVSDSNANAQLLHVCR